MSGQQNLTSEVTSQYLEVVVAKSEKIKDSEARSIENITTLKENINKIKSFKRDEINKETTLKSELINVQQNVAHKDLCTRETVKKITELRELYQNIDKNFRDIYKILNECKNEESIIEKINLNNKNVIDKIHFEQQGKIKQLKQSLKKNQEVANGARLLRNQQLNSNKEIELKNILTELEIKLNELNEEEDINYKNKDNELSFKLNEFNENMEITHQEIRLRNAQHEELTMDISYERIKLDEDIKVLTDQLDQIRNEINMVETETCLIENHFKEENDNYAHIFGQSQQLLLESEKFKSRINNLKLKMTELENDSIEKIDLMNKEYLNIEENIMDKRDFIRNEKKIKDDLEQKLLSVNNKINEFDMLMNTTKNLIQATKNENIDYMQEENILKKEISASIEENHLKRETVAALKGKTEIIEFQIAEDFHMLDKEFKNIHSQIEQTELTANLRIKEIDEEMQLFKTQHDHDHNSRFNNYRNEVSQLEAEILNCDTENSKIKMTNSELTAQLKNLTLQSDSYSRQIKILQEKTTPTRQLLPPTTSIIPKKRAYDEFSDSSVEGPSYTIQQLNAMRKSNDRKKMVKIKKQKS